MWLKPRQVRQLRTAAQSDAFLPYLRDRNEAIVVSATNRPGDIDPAILRSGRLALHVEIGLPDEDARQAILETHLAGAPSALARDDHAALAAHTRGFTGANLETLVDRAKRAAALRDAPAITLEDFPSFEELDEIVDALEHESEALPDPNDPSQLDVLDRDAAIQTETDTRADDSEDDDATRGFQCTEHAGQRWETNCSLARRQGTNRHRSPSDIFHT